MSVDCAMDDAAEARARLRADGWCVVNIGSAERKALARFVDDLGLGSRQHHLRGDGDGIVEVTARSTTAKAAILKKQYLDLGTGRHDPHTDGAMLDGVALADGRQTRVSPPAYVCMQMVQPARRGGVSLIVDCRPLFEDLVSSEPNLFRQLVAPCVLFCRDDDQSGLGPVLRRIPGSARWAIRWRFDFTTVMLESSFKYLLHFQRTFVCNPEYRHRFRLDAGQILVVDNFRVLHGREEYEDDAARLRLLHRLWVADRAASLVSPTATQQGQYALRRLHHYLPMTSDAPHPHHDENGIRLQRDTERTARKLLIEACLEGCE